MELEIITLSEVNQTGKDKYHMLSYAESRQKLTNEWENCKMRGLSRGGVRGKGEVGMNMIEELHMCVWN
jgi:hypothetical protein